MRKFLKKNKFIILFWTITAPLLCFLSFSLYSHVLFENDWRSHRPIPKDKPSIIQEYKIEQ